MSRPGGPVYDEAAITDLYKGMVRDGEILTTTLDSFLNKYRGALTKTAGPEVRAFQGAMSAEEKAAILQKIIERKSEQGEPE